MSPHKRRAEQAAIAQRLRTDGGGGEGLTIAAIAREMGISVSYAGSLLIDPTGEIDRARKRKYLKRCKVCGVLCYGDRCHEHSVVKRKPRWTEEMVIEAIQEWEIMYGRPPVGTEWAKTRSELPEWIPSTRMVYKVFGKGGWNKAIEAAGFTPRPAQPPEYTHAGHEEWTPERRQAQSDRLTKLYEENPDHPQFSGIRYGQELERPRIERRRRERAKRAGDAD